MKTNTKTKTAIVRYINAAVVKLTKQVVNMDQLMDIFTFEEAAKIGNAFYSINIELQKAIERLEKDEKQEKMDEDKNE